MKILWILLFITIIVRSIGVLYAHYSYDHEAVTIIGNCSIPILAAFLVSLMNELQRLIFHDDARDDDQ